MAAPDTVYIVCEPFLHGKARYERGDRYDRLHGRPDLSDEIDRAKKATLAVRVATPELYANCMAHHGPKHIGRGFTAESLVEFGLITPEQGLALGRVNESYKGYFVVPVPKGKFCWYQVTNKAGDPMREKMFRSPEVAKGFIDGLPEISDDGDVSTRIDEAA